MKLDKEKRKSIASAQKITESISKMLGKGDEVKDNKDVDLTKIAQNLAERREQVLESDTKE